MVEVGRGADQEVPMLRKGTKVERLTKKVGQVPETGKIVDMVEGHAVEVKWDDGHTSIISRDAVTPVTDANRPDKG